MDTDSLLSQNWPPSPPVRWRSCSETDSASTKKHGWKKREKNAQNAMEFLISVDLGKVWPPLPLTAAGDQVKIEAPPRYSGKAQQSVHVWLTQMEQYIRLMRYSPSDWLDIVAMRVEGAASS